LAKVEQKDEIQKPVAGVAAPPDSATAAVAYGARPATVRSAADRLVQRLPRFLMSGWAAAFLLCGVLIGMGIVLITHRPS
jgi:hypothetical protein